MEIGHYVFAKLDPDDLRSGTKEGVQDNLWGGPTQEVLTDAFVKAELKDIVGEGLHYGQKGQASLFNTRSLKEVAGCCFFLQLVVTRGPNTYAEDLLKEKSMELVQKHVLDVARLV